MDNEFRKKGRRGEGGSERLHKIYSNSNKTQGNLSINEVVFYLRVELASSSWNCSPGWLVIALNVENPSIFCFHIILLALLELFK